jgi:hypothetical protein
MTYAHIYTYDICTQHTYCSHFLCMADLDIVQVGADSNVVAPAIAGGVAAPRRRRLRSLPLLCFARDHQARQHAIAFLFCAPFVTLPEQVWTAEQTALRQTNLDYKPAYYVDYCVTSVVPFDVPLSSEWPPDLPRILDSLANGGPRSREAFRLVQRQPLDSLETVSMPTQVINDIIAGHRSLLHSLPLRSQAQAQEACPPYPPPSQKQFLEAARKRSREVGFVFRQRKRHRAQADDDAVRGKILWSRASVFLRSADKMKDASNAVMDAILGDFDFGKEEVESANPPSKRQLLKNRIKIDVVSCLLQRREVRGESPHTVRGVKIDASPKLHAEILAIEMETVPAGVVADVCIEKLPGSTLLHGASRLAHKMFLFLWGLFLTHASSLSQMRVVLGTFRWITSDQGVEAGMCDAADCLPAFWHWVSGYDAATSPPIDKDKYLLPLAVYMPGWNHLWSNLLRESISLVSHWPRRLRQLRSLTKFLRIYDYRYVWAKALLKIGRKDLADELLKPYLGSFVQWRWETLALVVVEIGRIGFICRHFLLLRSSGSWKTRLCWARSQPFASMLSFSVGSEFLLSR